MIIMQLIYLTHGIIFFGPESEKCLIKAVYGATTRPRILWEKNYGGSLGEQAESIIELKDGNLIVVGRSESKDGNVSENHGEWDYWIVKINPDNRSIIWERSYGGSKMGLCPIDY